MTRFFMLARVLSSSAARSAARLFLPTYFGLGVLGIILFGPNALRSAEVTRAALTEPAASVALWGAWIILTTPIARAALSLPDTFFLRSMPAPHWHFVLIHGAHLVIVNTLWIALWARGEGPLGAITAAVASVAAHSLIFARPRRPAELAAAIALALAIGACAPLPLVLAAAVFAAPVGLSAAFQRAPERAARARRAALPSTVPAALAAAYLRSIRRSDAAVFSRALLVGAFGGLVAPLAARGHQIAEPSSVSALSLGVAVGTLSIAVSGVAAAVLRAEYDSRWLLDSSSASGAERVLAASSAVALCGAAIGLIHGSLVSVIAGAAPALAARLLGLSALLGASIAVAAAWQARRAGSEGSRRSGRALARFIAFGLMSIAAIGLLGESALALIAFAALLLAAQSARSAADLPEPLCARRSSSEARGSA